MEPPNKGKLGSELEPGILFLVQRLVAIYQFFHLKAIVHVVAGIP